jgi:hypothetical protein
LAAYGPLPLSYDEREKLVIMAVPHISLELEQYHNEACSFTAMHEVVFKFVSMRSKKQALDQTFSSLQQQSLNFKKFRHAYQR